MNNSYNYIELLKKMIKIKERKIEELQLKDDYIRENGEYIEHCKYTITLR